MLSGKDLISAGRVIKKGQKVKWVYLFIRQIRVYTKIHYIIFHPNKVKFLLKVCVIVVKGKISLRSIEKKQYQNDFGSISDGLKLDLQIERKLVLAKMLYSYFGLMQIFFHKFWNKFQIGCQQQQVFLVKKETASHCGTNFSIVKKFNQI